MQREEAVERDVGDVEVAADPFRQRVADRRDGAEQRHDHLRAPVGHVAPRQQVAHEGLGHQREVDQHAEDPQQFARLLVRAVQQRAEHVQVDDDEERRGAGGVDVADQPAPLHVAHDVFDGAERVGGRRLVVHGQEDPGQDLDDQHHQRERAEVVPEVEVLRRVVLGHLRFPQGRQREALVDPRGQRRERPLPVWAATLSEAVPITRSPSRRRSGCGCRSRTGTAAPAGWSAPARP